MLPKSDLRHSHTAPLMFGGFNYTLIASIVFCSIFSVLFLSLLGLTVDELGAWAMAKDGPYTAIDRSVAEQGQAPLYFILLSLWIKIFGDSALALRMPSILASALCCFIFAAAAKRLGYPSRIISISIISLALSPLWISYSIIARPYGLANLFIAFTLWATLAINSRTLALLCIAAISSVTVLTHYLFALPLVCVIFLASWRARFGLWRSASLIISSVCGSALGLAMIAQNFSKHLGSISSIAFTEPPSLLLTVVCLAILPIFPAFILRYFLLRDDSDRGHSSAEILELCATVGLIISLCIASHLLNATLLLPRYCSIAIFPAILYLMSTLQRALSSESRSLQSRALQSRALKSIFAPHIIVTTILSAFLCYNFILSDSRMVNSINTAIKAPSEYSHCPLFISSLFIESAIPDRLEDQGLQSFLRGPLNYYNSDNFELLPICFTRPANANRHVSEIRAKIESSGCARLMLSNFKLGDAKGPFLPGTFVINGLLKYNYRIIQLAGPDLMPYFVVIR
jgi:hypothetical protein